MGEALRRAAGDRRDGRGAAEERLTSLPRAIARAARPLRLLALVLAVLVHAISGAAHAGAQPIVPGEIVPGEIVPGDSAAAVRDTAARPDAAVRLDSGRFTIVAYPRDATYARALLAAAVANDTFPGLPRPQARVVIAVAPDERRFRSWTGPRAPEWGVAVAFPASGRIVMRGRGAEAARYAPLTVLRHEIAHLALHEALGDLPPRWFEEGYASFAAGEWGREEMLATNVALLFRRVPPLDTLDARLTGRAAEAQGAYALSHRAVAELAALDPERGLTNLFRYWKETARLDAAIRRAYGITLDAFEERWQERTRMRYGVLALAGNLGLALLFVILVTTPFILARRQRDRARLEALRAADRRADREAAAVLAVASMAVAGSADGHGTAGAEADGTRPSA